MNRMKRRVTRRTRRTRRVQRAGACVHQPPAFFRGGFYPSLMGGVLQNGPYLMGAAFTQGARLIEQDKKRRRSRRKSKA